MSPWLRHHGLDFIINTFKLHVNFLHLKSKFFFHNSFILFSFQMSISYYEFNELHWASLGINYSL